MKEHKIKPTDGYILHNKVYKKAPIPDNLEKFGRIYIETRQKEGRVYTDSQLLKLPEIEENNEHANEWKIRSRSAKLLKKHIETNNLPKNILEIGCGNGWLSNLLAQIPESEVWGMDVNIVELEQAARVFLRQKNLNFIEADIFNSPFIENSFDFIVLASVIQYFPDLDKLLSHLMLILKNGGEIHILDSPFYNKDKLAKAEKRSQNYYNSIGAPEMANSYFYHSLDEIPEKYEPKFMYNPNSFTIKLKKLFSKTALSPFPWLMIKKNL